MNLEGESQFEQSRIEWAIRLRYSPMPSLDMARINSQLNAFRIGDLSQAGRTWEIMMERDGELSANAIKRYEDLAALEYEIMSDGSPKGDKHAASLKYFYDHCKVSSALEQDEIGDVSLLIHQMASAIANRYSIHEILLRVDNPSAKEVTAEFRHTPIWFFESRRGYLGFLKQIFDLYGQPLKEGEWLSAVGYGHMRACSIGYAMKHFPLRDLLLYCSRYGFPHMQALTDATKGSQEWNDLNDALKNLANDAVTITNRGVEIKFLESANKGNLPFMPLVELVHGLYAKLFRGSDLATGTKESAGGGNQVGASVQGGEKSILLRRDAKWSTGILNARVDRPVIRYLYNEEPRAWIKVIGPSDDDTQTDVETAGFLVQNNVPIAVSTARERFNWPEPKPGEPVLQPLSALAKPVTGVEGQDANDTNPQATGAVQGSADVQATALNGAQVTALADLVEKVAAGLMPLGIRQGNRHSILPAGFTSSD
jgi:phage gp29-like protein